MWNYLTPFNLIYGNSKMWTLPGRTVQADSSAPEGAFIEPGMYVSPGIEVHEYSWSNGIPKPWEEAIAEWEEFSASLRMAKMRGQDAQR